MNSGYRVEYSEDWKQVCIMPDPSIPAVDLLAITDACIKLGYTRWLPADHRGGFLLEKKDE
jgi:hypothetical protein